MTVQEAAEYLGISPQRVRQFIKSGRLKATRHGRDWWITTASANAFLELPRKNGRPPKH